MLVFNVLFHVVYQTRKKVVYHILSHREEGPKHNGKRSIFDETRGVLICDETLSPASSSCMVGFNLIAHLFIFFQKCSNPAVSGDCILAVNRTGVHFLSHVTVVSET